MLLEALTKKLEGEIAVARANIKVYLKNSVGIGEHPDVVEAIETQIEKIAAADEKIETIRRHFAVFQAEDLME
tara:strand:- start:3758 stop:3976 length:219 start_codon:yes stop_codon:yes gene_type:complete